MEVTTPDFNSLPLRMNAQILRSYPWCTGILAHPSLQDVFDSNGDFHVSLIASDIHEPGYIWPKLSDICDATWELRKGYIYIIYSSGHCDTAVTSIRRRYWGQDCNHRCKQGPYGGALPLVPSPRSFGPREGNPRTIYGSGLS